MGFLAQIVKGYIVEYMFLVVYGRDGLGKSTLAAGAPGVIFIDVEGGTGNLNVQRFPKPPTFNDLLAQMLELQHSTHDFLTVAIDSADWVERLIWKSVEIEHGVTNIEKIPYGKGFIFAEQKWNDLVTVIKALKAKMNVLLIAHAKVRNFSDPSLQQDYARYELKLHDRAAALVREASDAVLFMSQDVTTFKDDRDKTRAVGDGQVVLYTQPRPGWDAKSRFDLEFKIPVTKENGWLELEQAIERSRGISMEDLRTNIEGLTIAIKDASMRDKAVAQIMKADSIEKLQAIKLRVLELAK